jgi:hypothetical protein
MAFNFFKKSKDKEVSGNSNAGLKYFDLIVKNIVKETSDAITIVDQSRETQCAQLLVQARERLERTDADDASIRDQEREQRRDHSGAIAQHDADCSTRPDPGLGQHAIDRMRRSAQFTPLDPFACEVQRSRGRIE